MLLNLMEKFPLFHDLIDNVELGMAKADLSIATLYASLVSNKALRDRVIKLIEEEFERTRRVVLELTGQATLLERNPVLARSIRLRNPYVDPLSLIQVELLRRKRAGENDDNLNYALAATINGIAAGLGIRASEIRTSISSLLRKISRSPLLPSRSRGSSL